MKIPSAPAEMPAAMANLRDSWHTHLQAERKSQHSIRTNLAGVDTFARWCHAHGLEPAVNRPTVEKFTGALLAVGAESATAKSRQRGLRRFSAWLAARNRGPLTYYGLYTGLRRRAQDAGFTMHPDMLRSTGAIRWRAAGGSVPGLLTVAGWSSLDMAQRYVRAAESRLAVDEAHTLNLGDL